MSEVKRYDPSEDSYGNSRGMKWSPYGDYVLSADYDAMKAERDQLRDRIAQLEARNAELLQALIDAAQSLATISKLAGKDEFMRDLTDTRSYAKSRAGEALRTLTQQDATQ